MEIAIISIVILIFSVILHEVAHGYAADMLGDPTARREGRLTLNPLAHVDWYGSVLLPAFLVYVHSPIMLGWAKPVPYNPHNMRHPYAEGPRLTFCSR
jgi:Zn-dependent protease